MTEFVLKIVMPTPVQRLGKLRWASLLAGTIEVLGFSRSDGDRVRIKTSVIVIPTKVGIQFILT